MRVKLWLLRRDEQQLGSDDVRRVVGRLPTMCGNIDGDEGKGQRIFELKSAEGAEDTGKDDRTGDLEDGAENSGVLSVLTQGEPIPVRARPDGLAEGQ
jgi:hypothetical protein